MHALNPMNPYTTRYCFNFLYEFLLNLFDFYLKFKLFIKVCSGMNEYSRKSLNLDHFSFILV